MILDTSNEDRFSDNEDNSSFEENTVTESDDSIKHDLIDMRKSYDDIFDLEKQNSLLIEDSSNLMSFKDLNSVHSSNNPYFWSLPNLSSLSRSYTHINFISQQHINTKSSLYYLAEKCKEIYKNNLKKKYLPNYRRKKNINTPEILQNDVYGKSFIQKETKRFKREYKKKSHRKNIIVSDPLSIEIEETIESFADFSDSMFRYKVQDTTKMFLCPELNCDVELPSLSRIKRHYLIHTNLKPFKCLSDVCEKKFSRKDNMLQHYRTHCKGKRK